MYVPKEISLDCYNAPPSTDNLIAKPYLAKTVPNFQAKNPWLQSNGNGQTEPNNQTYFKVSTEPITSPWHEMERKTPRIQHQSNWIKPQPNYDYKPNPQQYENPQPQYQKINQYQPPSQYQPLAQPTPQYRSQQQFKPQPLSNDTFNQNFNTAARGWNGSKMGNCYKPITFGQQPKKINCMQYTDF